MPKRKQSGESPPAAFGTSVASAAELRKVARKKERAREREGYKKKRIPKNSQTVRTYVKHSCNIIKKKQRSKSGEQKAPRRTAERRYTIKTKHTSVLSSDEGSASMSRLLVILFTPICNTETRRLLFTYR